MPFSSPKATRCPSLRLRRREELRRVSRRVASLVPFAFGDAHEIMRREELRRVSRRIASLVPFAFGDAHEIMRREELRREIRRNSSLRIISRQARRVLSDNLKLSISRVYFRNSTFLSYFLKKHIK